ncbi:tail protein X [Paraburkholderia lycopersici]|uniref:P2-like prophage tail protein X n=1 Tax=Paraburkholderia lycopersici TaxID=416944 RepID=A0A1G7CPX0_9BURK|nr:tail protein X [Paraburkholderia lycopersici]SDE41474.1 P2-like prophage tail protein X [Paraburkholderia lycopersici]
MARIYSQQGDTVDAICFRFYGYTAGAVEATLETNPGLADYGPVLPIGTPVDMPDLTNEQPTTPLVNLWD